MVSGQQVAQCPLEQAIDGSPLRQRMVVLGHRAE
jgi:hypothetical protein